MGAGLIFLFAVVITVCVLSLVVSAGGLIGLALPLFGYAGLLMQTELAIGYSTMGVLGAVGDAAVYKSSKPKLTTVGALFYKSKINDNKKASENKQEPGKIVAHLKKP